MFQQRWRDQQSHPTHSMRRHTSIHEAGHLVMLYVFGGSGFAWVRCTDGRWGGECPPHTEPPDRFGQLIYTLGGTVAEQVVLGETWCDNGEDMKIVDNLLAHLDDEEERELLLERARELATTAIRVRVPLVRRVANELEVTASVSTDDVRRFDRALSRTAQPAAPLPSRPPIDHEVWLHSLYPSLRPARSRYGDDDD